MLGPITETNPNEDQDASFSLSSDESYSTDDINDDAAEEEERDEVKNVQKLAQRESTHVEAWRWFVFFAILVTATGVTVLTYMFLERDGKAEFENSFRLFAFTVTDSIESSMNGVVEATEGLSASITAHAAAAALQWPFITYPNFEVNLRSARSQSKAELFLFSPIVGSDNILPWNLYSMGNQGWIEQSYAALKQEAPETSITPFIYNTAANGTVRRYKGDAEAGPAGQRYPAAPIWQMSPPPDDLATVNNNTLASPIAQAVWEVLLMERSFVIPASGTYTLSQLALQVQDENETANQADLPKADLFYPVFESLDDQSSAIVGLLRATLSWDQYLANLLPDGANGVYVVFRNSCDQSFTFVLNGRNAEYLGMGDQHKNGYNNMEHKLDLSSIFGRDAALHADFDCLYSVSVYPSETLHDDYASSDSLVLSIVVALCTVFMGLTFFIYDVFVQRKNRKIIGAAAISNAIVSSLFPSNVRDRLFNQGDNSAKGSADYDLSRLGKHGLKSFLAGGTDFLGETDDEGFKTKPIADLFPETTIMFCDLVGFTAWSSVREPSQVFTLLETVYHAFDQIAKARRVFKVETVGDCYVAVTGLPDPRKDHAVAMARFAHDCLRKIGELTKKLEVTLGPDTGDLSVRVGLHSGPVTAGVLRGERSRFQLFGDTMNTASRMESTGKKGQIQLSQETADLLIASGKAHWLSLREDKVVAKGKGELQTYWLEISTGASSSAASTGQESDGKAAEGEAAAHMDGSQAGNARNLMTGKVARLIDWNSEVLGRLLKQIIASRDVHGRRSFSPGSADTLVKSRGDGSTVLDEVKEIIMLPEFNARHANNHSDFESLELPEAVNTQLHDYVCNIAALYRENPFHNFEHASHVTMSVVKLLSRIVAPTDIQYEVDSKKKVASMLHDHTYGITSDPLTQFACALSALIHDVDHMGVPNMQLIQENPQLAATYKNKSVAEQNSVDLAWDLLMDDNFRDLRGAIYSTPAEMQRFRQLVVNSVMATDIMDKDLKALRNARWDKAFMKGLPETVASARDNVNRKATIVIEHLIQASDVAHTMQHWHIYRKWNERLFREMTIAYKQGRSKANPADNWYKGELGFFDFYIIPLAKKLKECGVFGVSSDEYLNYAEKNREEWEERGQQVVAEMLETLKAEEKSVRSSNHSKKNAGAGGPQPESGAANVDQKNTTGGSGGNTGGGGGGIPSRVEVPSVVGKSDRANRLSNGTTTDGMFKKLPFLGGGRSSDKTDDNNNAAAAAAANDALEGGKPFLKNGTTTTTTPPAPPASRMVGRAHSMDGYLAHGMKFGAARPAAAGARRFPPTAAGIQGIQENSGSGDNDDDENESNDRGGESGGSSHRGGETGSSMNNASSNSSDDDDDDLSDVTYDHSVHLDKDQTLPPKESAEL